MRSAFSLQVSATVVLCHVKLMSGVLSLEVGEQMLCSGLCNSAATSIVYLFTSFLGSDVNVETRCIGLCVDHGTEPGLVHFCDFLAFPLQLCLRTFVCN